MNYKYFAFISYNSKDTEWGKKLQQKLEHYRMPATLCSEHGWVRTPIKPVFFAPTDIQPGGLTEELQDRLRTSKNLIVICSPSSAKSEWVGKEIEFFHQLGRTKQIHFFIVNGVPHSGNPNTDCFNPIVDTLGLPEILGANIHEKIYRWPWMNKERAYVQLISKLLDVEFDAIWQRHKRFLFQKIVAWAIGIIIVLAALFYVWVSNQPVDVEVRLNEASVHNDNLPPLKDAVVTMTLENETKTDTIASLKEVSHFINIPHHFINQKVRIQVVCQDFLPLDTMIQLSEEVTLNLYRNPKVYGDIHFILIDDTNDINKPRPNTEVIVGGHKVLSNAEGIVSLYIPLEEQKESYSISSISVTIVDKEIKTPCHPSYIITCRK